MNEHTLTDAERDALIVAFIESDDSCAHNMVPAYGVVERIVAARVAEAVDRERAAWATKIEQVCGWGVGRDTGGVDRLVPASELRALLSADDTEGKAPRIDTIKYRGKA